MRKLQLILDATQSTTLNALLDAKGLTYTVEMVGDYQCIPVLDYVVVDNDAIHELVATLVYVDEDLDVAGAIALLRRVKTV
jgi:hypothetical protein